jgi:hypothetical protein
MAGRRGFARIGAEGAIGLAGCRGGGPVVLTAVAASVAGGRVAPGGFGTSSGGFGFRFLGGRGVSSGGW